MSLSIVYRDVRLQHAERKPHGTDQIPGLYALSCSEKYEFGSHYTTGMIHRKRFQYSGSYDNTIAMRCECGLARSKRERKCSRCGSTKPAEER